MDSRTLTLAGLVIGVQIGLFAWLKADIADLAERVNRVETEVAFIRGQLSAALPSLAQSSPPPAPRG